MSKISTHSINEAAELCSLYAMGSLDEGDRVEFQRHLEEGCPVCDAEISRASATLRALAETQNQALPSGMRQRLQMRLSDERRPSTKLRPSATLMSESGIFIARTESMEWRAGPVPGIWVKPLFVNWEERCSTSLIRMDAGSRYPSHRHSGLEEVFLIEGDLTLEGLVLRPGDYCSAQPSSAHQESLTEKGCVFILRASA